MAAIQRTRGLVRVDMEESARVPRENVETAQPGVGEAVLQFTTLQ